MIGDLIWECVGYNKYGAIWGLGEIIGEELMNIRAIIERMFNGSWFWHINLNMKEKENFIIHNQGNSPSRMIAIEDVGKVLDKLKENKMIDFNIKCNECGKAMCELDNIYCEKCYRDVERRDSYIKFIKKKYHNLCLFLVIKHLDIYKEYKKSLETEKFGLLGEINDFHTKIEGLDYRNRELEDENEYLLKRIEDLEDNLSPSCDRK